MAGRAIFRSWLVEEHSLGGHHFRQFVTLHAAHILVRTPQGEFRPLLVVKQRWLPLHAGVALRAQCSVRFGELLSVDVLVAVLALGWCGFEVHIHQFGFQVGRLMAIDAGRRPMCAQ